MQFNQIWNGSHNEKYYNHVNYMYFQNSLICLAITEKHANKIFTDVLHVNTSMDLFLS